MGRKKLPMNLISKKRARLVCFEKRKKGLKKAAHELSTLCGVDIGMIIYDRDSNESEICGTTSLERMTQLYDSSSGQDRRCRVYTVADYVKEEMEKAKKMRDKKGRDECGRLSLNQLRELGEFLDARIAAVRGKISSIKMIKAEADDRVFLNPNFLNQESGLFLWGNPSLMMQEGLFSMADNDVYGYGGMQDLMEASTNPMIQDYEGSELAWGNSGLMMQETFFLPEQQQIDLCNNVQDLVNQSVEGTQNLMPGVIQHYHPQEYQSNMF